jgi:hypothetical protein
MGVAFLNSIYSHAVIYFLLLSAVYMFGTANRYVIYLFTTGLEFVQFGIKQKNIKNFKLDHFPMPTIDV